MNGTDEWVKLFFFVSIVCFWPAVLLMTLRDCVETPSEPQHRVNLICLRTAQCFDTNRLRESQTADTRPKKILIKYLVKHLHFNRVRVNSPDHSLVIKVKIQILPVLSAATWTHQSHCVCWRTMEAVWREAAGRRFNRLWINLKLY